MLLHNLHPHFSSTVVRSKSPMAVKNVSKAGVASFTRLPALMATAKPDKLKTGEPEEM
jgi:hypothetical protein